MRFYCKFDFLNVPFKFLLSEQMLCQVSCVPFVIFLLYAISLFILLCYNATQPQSYEYHNASVFTSKYMAQLHQEQTIQYRENRGGVSVCDWPTYVFTVIMCNASICKTDANILSIFFSFKFIYDGHSIYIYICIFINLMYAFCNRDNILCCVFLSN